MESFLVAAQANIDRLHKVGIVSVERDPADGNTANVIYSPTICSKKKKSLQQLSTKLFELVGKKDAPFVVTTDPAIGTTSWFYNEEGTLREIKSAQISDNEYGSNYKVISSIYQQNSNVISIALKANTEAPTAVNKKKFYEFWK